MHTFKWGGGFIPATPPFSTWSTKMERVLETRRLSDGENILIYRRRLGNENTIEISEKLAIALGLNFWRTSSKANANRLVIEGYPKEFVPCKQHLIE
jgi:hypothetical protein